ncbi:hypothetical protein H1R20_g12663, partial [Candolleomyces eurysporus]
MRSRSLCLLVAAFALFATLTVAAPLSSSLSDDGTPLRRALADIIDPDFERRALSQLQVNQKAAAVMREQKNIKKAKKASKRNGEKLKKGCDYKGPLSGVADTDKTRVHNSLKGAGNKHKVTQNLPGRKDTFKGHGVTRTGKAARLAVFNSHLHSSAPLSAIPPLNAGQPKHFGNSKYRLDHPNASLRGGRPLPNVPSNHPGIKEFPVVDKKRYPVGYHGGEQKGTARVITGPHEYNDANGKKVQGYKFHGMVTHTKANDKDHYKMQHHPHSPPSHYPGADFGRPKTPKTKPDASKSLPARPKTPPPLRPNAWTKKSRT